jgi:hypothetical protein
MELVNMAIGTRSQVTFSATAGGTGDTFDAVGNFDLSGDATLILGFWHMAGKVARTTLEGEHQQLRITVDSRVRGPFGVGDALGGSPATNEEAVAVVPTFLPLAIPRQLPQAGALGGRNVSFEFSSHLPDPTNAYSVVDGCLYWEGPLPEAALLKEIQQAAHDFRVLPFDDGDTEANGAVTTTGAAITNLDVKAVGDVCVGFRSTLAIDAAPAAGTEGVGSIDYTSTTITGFGTQSYPLPCYHAGLGTAVAGVTIPGIEFPAYIALQGAQRIANSITPTVRLNATIDASGVSATAYWR